MPTATSSCLHFGMFVLDLESSELRRRDGAPVKLSPKPAQLLALLARTPGRVLTREAIRHALWGADTFVDFEHALNFCVREVRAALGDSAKQPAYIETLPRRGYRFIAAVEERPADAGATGAPHEPALAAYGHYARGRKCFGLLGKDSLEEARQAFAAAIAIDPGYALAHSGLGAAHAMRSLNSRDPDDLSQAQHHLERALALDAELAEPYPWLCYVLMRRNQTEAALAAGERGVALQPDLVHAHYFLGLAHFAAAEAPLTPTHLQQAVTHLQNATRVGPHWQAAWFVLAYAALLAGQYEQANGYARRLADISREAKGTPFIGAEIVLATVALHQGDAAGARNVVTDFLQRLTHSDHMYRDAMSAAAACVLGDVELRHGTAADALAAYRRAWHVVQEHPRIMAYQRIAARAQAGLAAAYAAGNELERARDLLNRAAQSAQESERPEYAAAAATCAELYCGIATAYLRLGERAAALTALRRAVDRGWRDAAWLAADPALRELHDEAEWPALLSEVRDTAAVQFG